jgi:hypothetical protein
MARITFEARDYLNRLKDENCILRLVHFIGEYPDGRGQALVLNDEDRVAVMLEDCGDPTVSGIRAGDLVNYVTHPEGEPKIVGTPATIRP